MENNKRKRSGRLCRTVAIICVLLVLTGIFGVFPAYADEDAEVTTVRVGYYEQEVFEEGAAEGKEKKGYAYEYYIKLSEYTGWKYEYVYGSFNDLYQKLINGEIDLLAGLARKPEREELISYPKSPMGHETYSLVKHTYDKDVTSDPNTLNGKKIGVLDSAMVDVLNKYLSDHKVDAVVEKYADNEALFLAFDTDQVDILAAEGDGAYGRTDSEVLNSFGASDYYLCVNKKRPDLLDELDLALTMLESEESGYISSLNDKYYSVSIAGRAFSPMEKEWLESHTSLRVGYLKNFLPYSDSDKNGNVTGFIKDYIPEMLKRLDIGDIQIKYFGYDNYDRMVEDVGKGAIDLAFPVGGSLYFSEEKGIYQSYPVSSPTDELVFKGEYNEDVTEKFAVNKNNRLQYYATVKNFPDADIVYYSSIEECLDAVTTGGATCTLLGGLRGSDILKNSRFEKLSFRQLGTNENRCFGVKIGNEGLLRLVNRGVSLLGTPYAQNLAYRYLGQLYNRSVFDVIRENMGLFGPMLIVVALLIFFLLFRSVHRRKKQLIEKEKYQKELEEKNLELARSKEALSDALIAAEHANLAKTAFLNNMSHDIRTPMNAIVGFTAMAAANLDNKALVQDYLKKISISSRHLLSLINDVLDMSRIESGKMKIEEADVHLPDMIHDLWTIIQSNVKAKQLELFIDTKDVINEDIVTDKLRLNQVLLNILTNAIKFTPSMGTISFRVIEKPISAAGMTSFEFRVKDNGIGMSAEFQKTIFEAFTREQNTTVSGIQGTGLGMAITKNIVDMMGGTITVNSTEGMGSEFIVNIPCRISGTSAEYVQLPELEGLRALVADDDTDTCLSICAMLRGIGMHPDWTNYGKEAVIRAREAFEQADKFSAYIIDLLMPDLNGIETVRQIRKVIGDDTPIIILTAYDWSEVEAEARAAGVTGFCSKPLFMSELRNALAQSFRVNRPEPEPEAKNRDFTGKRILLAEDNEMNQMIAVSILEGAGFTVDIAEDGILAVEKMTDNPAGFYDVVLMDIQMPRMDGYEAAKRIRALDDEKKASIPIIAVTANAFEEDRKIALEAGMNGYLAKPYDIPMMMDTLNEIIPE